LKVSIKTFGIDMDIKSKGMELDVKDTSGKRIGDLWVTMTGLTWCPGKKHRGSGVKITWAEFIARMEAPTQNS
jgi:hypothetical protein